MLVLRARLPWLLLFAIVTRAAPIVSGAAERRLAVARLNVLGSVLMIGAHPDDENTPTLAYFARGRLMRTGYLSLTRGEGGQNLIGPEQGDLLGVIRTQELLAARRIDGAEQFFTRAIDFGFSKSAEETLEKWGRERILGDVVWVIRRFRPDVVILCFSGTPRDGHGQHQASGILGKEAFEAAADPKRFPEQLKYVEPWQAKRLAWNVYGGAPQVAYRLDTGAWNPLLGYSYGELAGMSRSMHRSQGMGTSPRRGAMTASLVHIAGERGSSLLDGVDTTWNRVEGGAEIGRILADALRSLDDEHPERTVPALLAVRARIARLNDPWAKLKLRELDEAVGLCSGLWLDATAERWDAVPGAKLKITATALKRTPVEATLADVSGAGLSPRGASAPPEPLPDNRPLTREFTWTAPGALSNPYWLAFPRHGDAYTVIDSALLGLAQNPPELTARFRIRFGADEIEIARPVVYRYADRSRGEITRPLAIVPAVELNWSERALVFPSRRPKTIRVALRAAAGGELRLDAPAGWKVEPARRPFEAEEGEQMLGFEITPPEAPGRGELRAVAAAGGQETSRALRTIAYEHFPAQVVFPPATAPLIRADITVSAKRIGYVMGAGDDIPEALEQLGCEVRLLSDEDLATADLAGFDAIVTGVRAYNVRPALRANQHRLFGYAERGGTLLVQYNVNDRSVENEAVSRLGPFPLRIGRGRVSVEEAPVTFTDPASPLLRAPNRITAADFEGWIQERGLYFASEWDPRYKTLFVSNDPGEPPLAGGTLYTKYGKGAYVFTAYSWFRQLPAGVPGAYRIFANLLSAAKVLE